MPRPFCGVKAAADAMLTMFPPMPPVSQVPAVAAAEALAVDAAARFAPRQDAAPAGDVAASFVLATDDLSRLAASAGLEWVHSDADKIRAVQLVMANEPQPIHVAREPKPVPVVDEGPLVLVETRKDLSQIRLPFDSTPLH